MVESERYKMIAPARVSPKALETAARNAERPRSAIRPASVYVFTQRFSLKIARLPRQESVFCQKRWEMSMFHLSSGNIVERVGQNEQLHSETHHQHLHLGLD